MYMYYQKIKLNILNIYDFCQLYLNKAEKYKNNSKCNSDLNLRTTSIKLLEENTEVNL